MDAETRRLAAEAWAEVRDLLDLQLSPLGLAAMAALAPTAGETIVDIGCGAGQTVLQLAERVGPHGRVIGVDIAPLLLDVARTRTAGLAQVSFISGDAAQLDLPRQSVDGLFSRFGVMAFENPMAAFSRLREVLRPSGRLAFVCWRSLEENELDLLPLRAAGLEDRIDRTPFSFEDPDKVRATLRGAGFQEVEIAEHDAQVSSGDVAAMATVLLRVGPLGKILRENPQLRADADPRVRTALGAKREGCRVALKAATWIVTARA